MASSRLLPAWCGAAGNGHRRRAQAVGTRTAAREQAAGLAALRERAGAARRAAAAAAGRAAAVRRGAARGRHFLEAQAGALLAAGRTLQARGAAPRPGARQSCMHASQHKRRRRRAAAARRATDSGPPIPPRARARTAAGRRARVSGRAGLCGRAPSGGVRSRRAGWRWTAAAAAWHACNARSWRVAAAWRPRWAACTRSRRARVRGHAARAP